MLRNEHDSDDHIAQGGTSSIDKIPTLKPAKLGVEYRLHPDIANVVIGDEEGLYISNYQKAAEHIAHRLQTFVQSQKSHRAKTVFEDCSVLEVCTGIGITTHFLAQTFPHVISVDKSAARLAYARTNLTSLMSGDNVSLLHGDILDWNVIKRIQKHAIQAVYTDAEFNMTSHWSDHTDSIDLTGPNTRELFHNVRTHFSPNIVMKVPKTIPEWQLRNLAPCEIEHVMPDGLLSFYHVYFGDLIQQDSSVLTFPKKAYESSYVLI